MSFFRAVWVMAVLVGVASGQTVLRRPAQGRLVDGPTAYAVPAATSDEVLAEMSGRAAVIFLGTVTAVRLPEEGGGVAEVEFAVSHAVRGVVGDAYVLREWAGLWLDGARYRVGDRRLMLLHAPGPGGLSSPVGGMDGAIPVAPGGVVASSMSGAAGIAGESVDLRWLEAKTLRGGGYVGEEAQVSDARPGAPAFGTRSGLLARGSLVRVVGMLKGWEAGRNAGR